MKKLLFGALLSVSLISSAFASDSKKVNDVVKDAFKNQFTAITNVEWTTKPEFVKATFEQNNKKVEAFYNYNGDFIGTSSAITIDELPTAAKRAFAKKYAGHTVKEAIRFDTDYEVSYYITAENEKELVTIEVKDNSLSVFRKNAKN